MGMSQKTHGHGHPREVCIVAKRSIESTAGTSSGIDSMKSRARLSRSGNGHWLRSRSVARFGFLTTLPSRAQVNPATADGILDLFDQIENQLLAVAAADEIHFRTLQFHQRRIQGREHATEGDLDSGIGRADLPGEELGIGITAVLEGASNERGLTPVDLFDNQVVRASQDWLDRTSGTRARHA